MNKKRILRLLCPAVLATQLYAGQSAAQAQAPTGATAPVSAGSSSQNTKPASNNDELQQLRERIAQQEKAIKQLQQSVEEQRALLEKAVQNADATASNANSSNNGAAVANASAPAGAANGGGEPAKMVPVANASSPQLYPVRQGGSEQHQTTETKPALGIRIGNTTFSPLGFVDATFFARSTNVGSGIGTNFGSIPYNNGTAGHLSEANFSTQNSRIGFRVDSTFLGAKVLGYFEADFLGNQPTNVFVTSNSDTFRMRNVFVDVQKNGFEFLGGQDWSLFTPNRKGLSPLPSDIFYTQNMDTNYQAGLPWARQTQFRFIAHPSDNIAFGVSLENPQQFQGNGQIALPSALNSLGAAELNGTTNSYSVPNEAPDIIFKAAYDGHPGNGRIMHVEAGALIRNFKDTFPFTAAGVPTSSTTGLVHYRSDTATAATGEVNANLEVVKNFRIIANTFFGSGGGRYLFGLGPDAVIRPDGTISPVHAYSTVDGFEANITKNTLVSMLYGGAYFGRNVAVDTDGSLIGYGYGPTKKNSAGFTSSPTTDNRSIQEATFDVVQTLWKNPNYGALSLIGQYSYLLRNPWYIAPGGARNARTNLYYIDLRYTLP